MTRPNRPVYSSYAEPIVGWTSAWLCALFGVGAALSVVAVFALGGYGNTVAKLAAAPMASAVVGEIVTRARRLVRRRGRSAARERSR